MEGIWIREVLSVIVPMGGDGGYSGFWLEMKCVDVGLRL